MFDFTFKSYQAMVLAFQQAGYRFQTFEEFVTQPNDGKTVIMRHDVDELAWNALKMAQLENRLGIRSTYFFRIVKQSNVPEVIEQVVKLGHEVGYHYEDLALAEGDVLKAMQSFVANLNYFRQYYPVRSACMHGSSTSAYDNRLLWENRQLSDFGLIGEPYLSIDFDKVFYMTDTGYAWDGGKYATRDIVESGFGLKFHTTQQVVDCICEGCFPEKTLILAHTLWTDRMMQWTWLHLREFFRNHLKLLAQNNPCISKLYKRMVDMYWKK